MTDDTKSPADAASKLRADLRALLRQRDQYALAMDAATDPKVSIRLQRTLERIEEEIEGLEEAVAALPPEEPEDGEALPDWDEEPSTSIYDPEKIQLHLQKHGASAPATERERSAQPSGADFDEEATIALPSGGLEQLRAQADAAEAAESKAPEPEPEAVAEAPVQIPNPGADAEVSAHEPEFAAPQDPAPAEAPEPAPAEEPEPEPAPAEAPEPEPAPAAAPEPAPAPQPPADAIDAAVGPIAQDEPAEEESNPLGPVWMDGLSPPTEELPRELADKLVPRAAEDPLSAVGDDPFALPSQSSQASQANASSPDAPTVATGGGFPPSPFDNLANPVSVLDDEGDNDWGFGAKAALFLAVAAFLAGVFYVLSIN